MPTNASLTTRGSTLAVTGAWLQLGSVAGVLGTVVGMTRVFAVQQASPTGVSDPQRLASAIGDVLLITAIGFGICLVGMIFLCVALLGSRYRAEWFFWFLVIYGALITCAFPLFAIFGIFFLVYCLTRRHEFQRRPATSSIIVA